MTRREARERNWTIFRLRGYYHSMRWLGNQTILDEIDKELLKRNAFPEGKRLQDRQGMLEALLD